MLCLQGVYLGTGHCLSRAGGLGLLGSQGAHMGRTLSPKHHRTMGTEPPGSMPCSNLQASGYHHLLSSYC